jgi:archaellum component FlaC
VDDKTVTCSKSLEEIEKRYEEIKENPSLVNSSRITLKSEEIVVNLQEKK